MSCKFMFTCAYTCVCLNLCVCVCVCVCVSTVQPRANCHILGLLWRTSAPHQGATPGHGPAAARRHSSIPASFIPHSPYLFHPQGSVCVCVCVCVCVWNVLESNIKEVAAAYLKYIYIYFFTSFEICGRRSLIMSPRRWMEISHYCGEQCVCVCRGGGGEGGLSSAQRWRPCRQADEAQ